MARRPPARPARRESRGGRRGAHRTLRGVPGDACGTRRRVGDRRWRTTRPLATPGEAVGDGGGTGSFATAGVRLARGGGLDPRPHPPLVGTRRTIPHHPPDLRSLTDADHPTAECDGLPDGRRGGGDVADRPLRGASLRGTGVPQISRPRVRVPLLPAPRRLGALELALRPAATARRDRHLGHAARRSPGARSERLVPGGGAVDTRAAPRVPHRAGRLLPALVLRRGNGERARRSLSAMVFILADRGAFRFRSREYQVVHTGYPQKRNPSVGKPLLAIVQSDSPRISEESHPESYF